MSDDKINVLFTLPFPQEMIERLQGISPRLAIRVLPAKSMEDIPEEVWADVEILYTVKVLPEPEAAPRLRWIQMHYAGVDHVLDHPLLDSEVIVTTMSGASAPQMAEFALLGLLAMGRRFYKLLADPPETQWAKDRYTRYQPRDLRGSTVGIVGYGSVGREIGRLCDALGMEVLACKQDLMKLEDEGYLIEGLGDPGADIPHRLYPPQAIGSMAGLCDFLIVTLPLSDQTRAIVNAAVFEAMRPTAYLIDISRGGVVKEADLLEALRNKQIAGAWLDVFEEEPLAMDHPFWEMENVILSPHIGGASSHYLERATELMSTNLQRYLVEQPLINRFDRRRGY